MRNVEGYLAVLGVFVGSVGLLSFPQAQASPQYVRPPSGGAYVVSSDVSSQVGEVVSVDVLAGRVVGAIGKGYEPDLLVSPDGSRLFVSYAHRAATGGVFQILDGGTGAVVTTAEDPAPWPSVGVAYQTRMALSRDAIWVYQFKAKHNDDGSDSYWIETIDARSGTRLPGSANLPVCGAGQIVPGVERHRVYVLCDTSQDFRSIRLDDLGWSVGTPQRLSVGQGTTYGAPAAAFLSQDGSLLTVIQRGGAVARVDVSAVRPAGRDSLDRVARRIVVPDNAGLGVPPFEIPPESEDNSDWFAGSTVPRQSAVVSPDGSRLYLMVARGTDTRAKTDRIVVFRTALLDRLATFDIDREIASISLTSSGMLLAVDRKSSALLVLDAGTGKLLRVINGVGRRPSFAVPVP